MLSFESRPRLAPSVRMEWDQARNGWLVQAPERLVYPDETASAVLALCDGVRTIRAIVEELAREYREPVEAIEPDVVALLQDLAERGILADAAA